MTAWTLECSAGDYQVGGDQPASVCPQCGQPLLARYATIPRTRELAPRWDLWRYRALLPIRPEETPVSLGEGATPLMELPELARELGVRRLWVKDEALNPTGSFKARG